MKKFFSILNAALLVAGVALTSCNKNDSNNPDQPKEIKTYHVSINASKGADNGNKANGPKKVLGLDGSTLTASWAAGEEVKVYKVDGSDPYAPPTYTLLGTLTAQSAGASTTLSGDLTGVIEAGNLLEFVFNGYPTDYRNQNGTLEYISAHCDLAIASESVESVDGAGNITLSDGTADFVSQQAIVKFTIKDKDNNDLPVTSITFTDQNGWMPNCVDPTNESNYSQGSITVTLASATNVIYVALYNREGFGGYESRSFSISAVSGGNPYEYSKTVTFDAGKYYTVTMKMAPPLAGRLSGMFTVQGETWSTPAKKVYFSQGNLQYSSGAYQFATNQWDYLGTTSGATYDLFPWHGSSSDLGKNAITNGGNEENAGWRTLTKDEWDYLRSHAKSAACQVDGVNGYIIAPDDYEGYLVGSTYDFEEFPYSVSQWAEYEAAGCIFIPQGTGYWSVTESDEDNAYKLRIVKDEGIYREMTTDAKTAGNSVRLVIDAN